MLSGVYRSHKKDGTEYFRSSITFSGKHISLGSFASEQTAYEAYTTADRLLHDAAVGLSDYGSENTVLSFSKWVVLINFRDNGMYIKTPIYLMQRFFHYYFEPDYFLIFDIEDLFYYSTRTISRRGGHLFVADYGMQVNILSRYGIKNYGISGKDYRFVNGDNRDFRYENIEVINRFHGVTLVKKNGRFLYEVRIHKNGSLIVGRYEKEIDAAVAYNKAASILTDKGYVKNYPLNYIEELSREQYHEIYQRISVSKRLTALKPLR